MVAQTSTRLERAEVEKLVREVLTQRLRGQINPPPARERSATSTKAGGPPHPLVVNVSARHMHVTPADLEVLFGAGAKLTKLTPKQSDYLGVSASGPYKADHYRY